MVRREASGGMLLEVLLVVGIMLLAFPMLHRNVRERANALRAEQVLRDMTLLKSLLEEHIENNGASIALGRSELLEVSGGEINRFLGGRGRRSFKAANSLGQNYMIKMKRAPEESDLKFEAIVVADAEAEIDAPVIREIVRLSRGAGGYVEGNGIYGANWRLIRAEWDGNHHLSDSAIVFKASRFKKSYQYISRTNPKYAEMHTDLHMSGNNIVGAGAVEADGSIESAGVVLSSGARTSVGDMTLSGGLTLKRRLSVGELVSFANGIYAPEDSISSRELKKIEIFGALNVMGDVRALSQTTASRVRLADVLELAGTGSELEIAVDTAFMILSKMGRAEIGRASAENISIKADSMIRDGVPTGLYFSGRVQSKADPRLGLMRRRAWNAKEKLEEEEEGAPTSFYGRDVIVRRINKELAGKTIGGIKIEKDTPLSVILRALSYEYANIYRLVGNKLPAADERYVPEWNVEDKLRCDAAECGANRYMRWDEGV